MVGNWYFGFCIWSCMLIERWMWRMVGLCAACQSIWWLWTLQNISILYNRGGIWRIFWHCTISINSHSTVMNMRSLVVGHSVASHIWQQQKWCCVMWCDLLLFSFGGWWVVKNGCNFFLTFKEHLLWARCKKQNSNNESRHIQGFGAVWWIKPQVIFTMTFTGIINPIGNPSLLLLGKMIINPGNFDLVIKLTL